MIFIINLFKILMIVSAYLDRNLFKSIVLDQVSLVKS